MERQEDLKQLTILLSEEREADPLLSWGVFVHLGLSVLLGTMFVVGTLSYPPSQAKVHSRVATKERKPNSLQKTEKPSLTPALLSTTIDVTPKEVVPAVLLPDFSLPPDVEDEYHEDLPLDVYHYPEPQEVDNTALFFPLDSISDVTTSALLATTGEPEYSPPLSLTTSAYVFGPQPPASITSKAAAIEKPNATAEIRTLVKPKNVSVDIVVASVARYFDSLGIGVSQQELADITKSSEVPRWMNYAWLVKELEKSLSKIGLTVTNQLVQRHGDLERLSVSLSMTSPLRLRFHKKPPRARVAIIVDDIGFGGTSTANLLAVKAPLTLAILPFCRGSSIAAQSGLERSFEVILHMPMEPSRFRNNVRANVALFVNMNSKQIQNRLTKALDSLPRGISGLNNHMGSLFTESPSKLDPVMKLLRERDFYFLDSVTTRKSVAFTRARRHGLPAGRRNFEFIDNKPGEKYSVKQFKRLIARTSTHKALITIMHDRKHSVAALAKMIDPIRKAGIELTYASALLEGGKGEKAKVAHRLQ